MTDPTVTSHHARAPRAEPGQTVRITIDGQAVDARPDQFLIAAAEEAGTFIPRFCYHPRMKPVGMCRMCLVEVEGPRGPSLQPACYLPVADGMEVVTTSDKVKKAQDGVLEFLLVNHPLDCPVCDKGGECPLQDQVLSYGPGESRFVEEKRHWAKPMAISELVLLDRERCIQCGRCVRFAAEVSGEAEIDFAGRGDRVEVSIFEKQPFSSYFSGNTVQICPVGALTATPYRFTARPWDVDQVESTCTTCALGCRVAVQSSANRITRLLGVDSDPVNHSWLCDKGRFAAVAVNSPERLAEPLVRDESGELQPATWNDALGLVARRLSAVRTAEGAGAIGVIGGARLTNEDAFAWCRLAKGVLGTDSVDAQLGDGLPPEVVLGLPRATIDQACQAKVLVVVSGDVRQELPVLFLRLRQAVVEGGATVVELGSAPGSLGQLGVAVAHRPGDGPAVARALVGGEAAPDGVDSTAWDRARRALDSVGDGSEVVVIAGRPSLAEHQAVAAATAVTLAEAWPKARFLPALRRGNVMGALDMGLAPGLLPGRVTLPAGRQFFAEAWGSVPESAGRDSAGILRGLADGELQALVLLGADPLGDFPDRALVEAALDRASLVVAVDGFLSPSAAKAHVVLPVALAHERSGTTTNVEGRISRVAQKVVAPGQCWPDWMVASELASRLGVEFPYGSIADLWDDIERLSSAHAGLSRQVLEGLDSRDGVVVPLAATPVTIGRRRLAPIDPMATPGIDSVERQGAPLRTGLAEPLGGRDDEELVAAASAAGSANELASGGRPPMVGLPSMASLTVPPVPGVDGYGLRLVAPRTLYDDGVAVDVCEHLAALVPEVRARIHPADLTGMAGSTPVRLRSSHGAITVAVVPDSTVTRGTVVVPFNVTGSGDADEPDGAAAGAPDAGAGAAGLIGAADSVVEIRMESVAP